MRKKWNYDEPKEQFDNEHIANLAINSVLNILEVKGIEYKNFYILVGNTKGIIVASRSIGNCDEAYYPELALAKFQCTVRTGRPSLILVDLKQYLSSWIEDNIIVVCLGDVHQYDEVLNKTICLMAKTLLSAEKLIKFIK